MKIKHLLMILTCSNTVSIINAMEITIKDTDIAEATGIPYQTLYSWKNRDDWRGFIYSFLHKEKYFMEALSELKDKDKISDSLVKLSITDSSKATGIPYGAFRSWGGYELSNWRGKFFYLFRNDIKLIEMIASEREKNDETK